MGFLERLEARAAAVGGRVALAEGHDERIVEAAGELIAGGGCEVTLICPGDQRQPIHNELAERGVDVADPMADPRRGELADHLHQRRAAKGMSRDEALAAVEDPLYFASLLVATGAADASVGGAVRTVSSAFIMIHPDPRWGDDGVMVFADCAVLPDPDSVQLAEIALSAAATFRSIVGGEPKVALLSFSTNGSAKHPLVDKVTAARAELETRGADFVFDGELQLDAALLPGVGEKKAPGSAVAGKANVLVFPDLNAGNITYKAVERLGGARALGPLMQGLAEPANDLSRGCSAGDIVQTSYLSLLQAKG